MRKFKEYLIESRKPKQHETEHGTVEVRTHLPGTIWRIHHPDSKEHFGQIKKLHDWEIPEHDRDARYRAEVRHKSGQDTGDHGYTKTRKSAINFAAYMLSKGFRS